MRLENTTNILGNLISFFGIFLSTEIRLVLLIKIDHLSLIVKPTNLFWISSTWKLRLCLIRCWWWFASPVLEAYPFPPTYCPDSSETYPARSPRGPRPETMRQKRSVWKLIRPPKRFDWSTKRCPERRSSSASQRRSSPRSTLMLERDAAGLSLKSEI